MNIHLPLLLIALSISGCATDTLKNEHAASVIVAGNKTVDANAEFFRQYYASREKYIVNFYATNPDCSPTPDYTLYIDSESSSLCQDKSRRAKAITNKIHLVPIEREKLLASLEIIQSMSAYTEMLTEARDVKDSKAVVLLNKALDHANNAGTLLALPEGTDLSGTAKAIKDLTSYFNALYKERESAEITGKAVKENWQRVQSNLIDLRNDIATRSQRMNKNTYASTVNAFHYYDKAKETEFKTFKSKQEFLAPAVAVNEGRLRMSDPAAPAIEAINTFIKNGEKLNDLYNNKKLSEEDIKRKREIIRQQIIGGLQASEGLAKLLVKSGLLF
ncbi:hypothetical protein QNN88_01185 [Citrobacter sp. ANG330]|uniref:hypothetical protein n=1 Tax=Citrobacter sp. ANG330 TaxID=3048142 RepID=UPI0039C4D18B